jgi:hypothetical protein
MATEAERILWQVRPCSMFDTSSDATLEDAHDPAYTPWGQGTNLQFAGSYYLNSDNTQESLPFIFLGCDARSSMLIEVQWKDPRTGLRAESALVIPVEAAAWYRIDDEPLKPELVNIEEIVAATIARFHFHPIGLASNAAFIKAQHGQDQAEEAMRHTEHELRAANVDNAELNSRIRSAEEAGQAAAAAHRDANARARRYAEENKTLTEAMDELRRQAEKAKNSDGEIARLKEKVKEANLDAHRTLVLKGERDSARAELEKAKAENEGLKEQLDTAHLLYDKASKKTAEVKTDQLQRLLKDSTPHGPRWTCRRPNACANASSARASIPNLPTRDGASTQPRLSSAWRGRRPRSRRRRWKSTTACSRRPIDYETRSSKRERMPPDTSRLSSVRRSRSNKSSETPGSRRRPAPRP